MSLERVHIPEKVRWHPAVIRSRLGPFWPLLVWVAAGLGALAFFFHGGRFGGMSGVVEARAIQIAPRETARLEEVLVDIGQAVRRGEVLARMDTTILDAELAAEELRWQEAFAGGVARARSELWEARLEMARDKAELEEVRSEIKRMDELVRRGLLDSASLSRLRAREALLKGAVEFYPKLLEALEQNVKSAENLEAQLGPDSIKEGQGGRFTRWSARRRESYLLRAPEDGTVAWIYHQPGEMVAAGDAVLSLMVSRTPRIIGFLPESSAREVKVGMKAYLAHAASGGAIIPARVTAITPAVWGLPNRANPFPRRAFRGRRVILEPVGSCDLLPGEAVSIYLRKPIISVLLGRHEAQSE